MSTPITSVVTAPVVSPAQSSFFESIALPVVNLGVAVIPLRAKGKQAFLPGWERLASTDLNQIQTWGQQYPDSNAGSVAKAQDGGYWFLEIDDMAVADRIRTETGKSIFDLGTFTVRSRPGRGHFYFRQNARSIAMGNLSQGFVRNHDWSARVHNQYVVSPGSIHPETGQPYAVVCEAPIIEAPDWLLDWLLSQKTTETVESRENLPKAQDPEQFEYREPETREFKNVDVSLTGPKIPYGAHDDTLISIAGKLHHDNPDMTESELTEHLIGICEARCENFGADYRQMCAAKAHSACKYPVKIDVFAQNAEQRAQEIKQARQSGLVSPDQQKPDVSNWRQEFKSVGELEKGEVRMLINHFLPEGVTFIGGLPGEGKTLLALSIAKALTTGKDFLGRVDFGVPSVVPVLYLIPEVAARAFRQRCEKFHIPDDPNLFLCRTISEGPTLLLDNPMVLEAAKTMKPVIFLDTVLRFNEAEDENAASQNKVLVEDLIRLRHAGAVSIVGLHHSTKNMHKEGMSLETVLRGTGDLAACCDAVYGLLRDDALYKHNSGPNEIDVACVKPRDFEPPEPFRIAASRHPKSGGGMSLGMVSYIDELGDFQVVSKAETEQAVGDWLERVVTDDPAITLAELEKSTKLSSWVIRQTLKRRGWTKARGGGKGGSSQWRKKTDDGNPFGKNTDGSSARYVPPKPAGSQSFAASFD